MNNHQIGMNIWWSRCIEKHLELVKKKSWTCVDMNRVACIDKVAASLMLSLRNDASRCLNQMTTILMLNYSDLRFFSYSNFAFVYTVFFCLIRNIRNSTRIISTSKYTCTHVYSLVYYCVYYNTACLHEHTANCHDFLCALIYTT